MGMHHIRCAVLFVKQLVALRQSAHSGITHRIVVAIHLAQAIWYRVWWCFPTAIVACITEIIGWSARLWSSHNPVLRLAFLIQSVPSIIP